MHFGGAPIALEMRSVGYAKAMAIGKKLRFKLHDDGDPKGKLRLGSGG